MANRRPTGRPSGWHSNIIYEPAGASRLLPGATPQVRGFFSSDFKPSAVIIVRPTQLGPNSSYAIARPGK